VCRSQSKEVGGQGTGALRCPVFATGGLGNRGAPYAGQRLGEGEEGQKLTDQEI